MKISFKNYKSFSQKSEFELRKFNILIGPNSSGKSSLAEIISYFIDVRLQQTKFYSENFNIDRYLTNPNALSGSTFTENEGFEPHAVFPKYYKMNNVDNFKNIEFDENGVNKDEYTNNQKYFFGFKDYKKFSDTFPDKIHMTYPLKARVHRRNLNTRDRWISRQERSDFTTNELLKNCDFYTKPDLFSNIKSLENEDIINSVDTFAVQLDEYISQLENHPEKTRGITNHEINVKYGKNFTQYSFLSKEPFLTGLNVINDKNSDESFIFHQDGTKIFNLIENTVFKLTKQVFKPELDNLENRFLPYKNRLFELFPNDRQYDYHLTMPLPIDKSKWDTSTIESIIDIVVGNTKDNTVVNAVEKPRNLWNHSPYLNSYYYYKSSSSNPRLDNVISGILPPVDGIRPQSVLSKVNTLNAYSQRFDEKMNSNQRKDLFIESPTNFFEWNDKFVNRRQRRFERRFTDYDFYKDFCLTKQSSSPRTVLNNLNKDFYHPTSKSKAIQPGYGVFFALTQPTLRMAKIKEDFETYDTIRRDLVSDTDEIIDFLKEVGYEEILNDFKLVNSRNTFGRIQTWEFKGKQGSDYEQIKGLFDDYGKYNGMLCLSLYAEFFRNSILSSSISYKLNKKSNNKLKKAQEKYKVTRWAILNQIDIIRMYLLRLSIVQFQKNAYKYLYHHYIDLLHKNVRLSLIDRSNIGILPNFRNTNRDQVFTIKPKTQNILSSNKSYIYKDELIQFFGDINRDMFEQVEIDDNLKINRSLKIKNFINSCLDDLNLGFRVGLENKKYEDGTDSQYFIFGIRHKLKDSKGKPTSKEFGDLVPIADVGMGNASIVSIIGSLYRFNNASKSSGHTIILREPETYLHPEWIEKMVRFLYDFIVGDNSKNLKLIIETHNETVLRTTQLIMKEKPEEYKDTIGAYFLLNKDDGKGTVIKDLEIKDNGFLAQKIESGFFSTNTDLISDLWNEDE